MRKLFWSLPGWTLTITLAALGFDTPEKPQLEAGFNLMYQLRFDDARGEIRTFEKEHPADPLGPAAEAASYLFEEFNHQGILTSSFFLDDDKLLGGIAGTADDKHKTSFLENNRRARLMAERRLGTEPRDPDGLLVLTLADGMEGDYEALIARQPLASLRLIRKAEVEATRLLAVQPNAGDAYVALGAANYIIGCLPVYKRVLLWFGGYHGDRQRGMEQLQQAADHGHYLQPLAKALLALVAEREHQNDRARALFADLNRQFPQNSVFARELALLDKR
ncbi:MAG: hypothetical protein LAP85_23915 [Acidobacteriia bacterium]|nr:hypothetical protein [Terriglobia bacterium]